MTRLITCFVSGLICISLLVWVSGFKRLWSGNVSLTIVFEDRNSSDWEILAISRDTGEVIASSKGDLHAVPNISLKNIMIGGTDFLFSKGAIVADLRDIEFVIRMNHAEERMILNSVVIPDSDLTNGEASIKVFQSRQ